MSRIEESGAVLPRHESARDSSLMETLRAATRSAHHRIDHHPALAPLVQADISSAQYQRILQCAMALHVPLHSLLSKAMIQMRLGERFQISPRLSWLNLDFDYLGIEPDADVAEFMAEGWQSVKWPNLDTPSKLVGALYVVEGSTLGGQVIARLLNKHLGVTPETGGRFYSGHGSLTQDRWQDFMTFAQSAVVPDDIPKACNSAQETFETIDCVLSSLSSLHALA